MVEQEQDAFDIRGDLNLERWGSMFGRYSPAHRDFVEPPTGNIFMAGGDGSSRATTTSCSGTPEASSRRLDESGSASTSTTSSSLARISGVKNDELGIPNGNIEGHPYTFGIADLNVAGFLRTASPGFTDSIGERHDDALG